MAATDAFKLSLQKVSETAPAPSQHERPSIPRAPKLILEPRLIAKQGRRLPAIAQIDPASSGRWFSGWRSGAPTSHDPPAVAAPRSWLLCVGWRRRGLIDPAEVPGST
jgi:hypothetical protein